MDLEPASVETHNGPKVTLASPAPGDLRGPSQNSSECSLPIQLCTRTLWTIGAQVPRRVNRGSDLARRISLSLIWYTAGVPDQGGRGTHESRMAAVICSEAIWRVGDGSMQILGGLGITDDTIVTRMFRA